MATFAAFQSLRKELTETKNQLANRKLISKAKGIFMEKENLSENLGRVRDRTLHRVRGDGRSRDPVDHLRRRGLRA